MPAVVRTMTNEELDAIEALTLRAPLVTWPNGDVSAHADGFSLVYPNAVATFAARDALLAEVRRLRALPVIEACSQCPAATRTPTRDRHYGTRRVTGHKDRCDHLTAPAALIVWDAAPPLDCPLRTQKDPTP